MTLIIFDMDGTLVYKPPDRFIGAPSEQTLLPGVAEKCEALNAEGATLAVASNQGGVAMGYLSYEEAEALVANAAALIGAAFYEFCPYHPEGIVPEYQGDADCRKPKPGMLVALMRRTGFTAEDTLMVGDSIEDEQAAAGLAEFQWASDFF